MVEPRSRVATIPLLGGRTCLDLVNTVAWRGDVERREDVLASARDALTWCERAGVLATGEATRLRRRPAGLLDELRDLRDVVGPWADRAATGDPTPTRSVQDLLRRALGESELVVAGSRFAWSAPGLDTRTPALRLALDLHVLLVDETVRIGSCEDADCGWVFWDRSRQRSRRWCSSADCGNRDRARRHRRRHR